MKLGKGKIAAIGAAAVIFVGVAFTPNSESQVPSEPPVISETKEISQKPIEENDVSADRNKEKTPIQTSDTNDDPTSVVEPEQEPSESLLQYDYVGSSESDKYHNPNCRWAKNIKDYNVVYFATEDEAISSGYVPCGTCNP